MDRPMPPATQLAPLSFSAATALVIQSGGSTMSLSIRAIRSPEAILTAASRLKFASRTPGGVSVSQHRQPADRRCRPAPARWCRRASRSG